MTRTLGRWAIGIAAALLAGSAPAAPALAGPVRWLKRRDAPTGTLPDGAT
jgi:hypothetical protein